MNKTVSLVIAFVFILLFSFPYSSHAIYQWVDKKGQIHITDYPPPVSQAAEEKEGKASSEGQTGETTSVPEERAAEQPAASPTMKQTERVQPLLSPVVKPLTGTQVRKPVEPAPQMPQQQTGKPVVAPPGPVNTVQPVPLQGMATPPAQSAPRQAVPLSGMPAFPKLQNGPSPEMIKALLAGFMTVFLIVGAGLYLYSSLCLFLIAKKLDVSAAWTAWIPILQVWAFFQSAGKSLWWIILCLIPFVGVIVSVYLWMCIAENLGKNKMLGLLILVPIANMILPAVLAFSKKEGTETSSPVVA